MIRPFTLRLLAILSIVLSAGLSAAAQAGAVETDAAPPAKNSVLDPSTFALIGLGLVGLAVFRRRTRRNDEA